MQNTIKDIIKDSIYTKSLILNNSSIIEQIQLAATEIVNALNNKGTLYLAGNGGSAADSQHIAAEFVVRLDGDRKALPAIALTTDSSILTAAGNDYGFNAIYQRQLMAHAANNDVFMPISTSGNSDNIIQAIEYCADNHIYCIGLSGKSGGKMAELCDNCIIVPSDNTARIQEAHILIGHIICLLVEQQLLN